MGTRRPIDYGGRGSITASRIFSAYRWTVIPPVPFVEEYSVDPAWAPDGRFVVFSGPDIGTTFSVKAVTAGAAAHPLPELTYSRSATPAFLTGGRKTRGPARGDPT